MEMVHGCPIGLGTGLSGPRLPNGAILLKEPFLNYLQNLNQIQLLTLPSKNQINYKIIKTRFWAVGTVSTHYKDPKNIWFADLQNLNYAKIH